MKKLVYFITLVSSFSSLAMNSGDQRAGLCNEFWNQRIEKTHSLYTELLEKIIKETNMEKKKSLKTDRDNAQLKMEKQRQALKYCIKEGIAESMTEFVKWM